MLTSKFKANAHIGKFRARACAGGVGVGSMFPSVLPIFQLTTARCDLPGMGCLPVPSPYWAYCEYCSNRNKVHVLQDIWSP